MITTIYLDVDKNGDFQWGTSDFVGSIPVRVNEDHPIFNSSKYFKYIDGKIVEIYRDPLRDVKLIKEEELSIFCEQAILSGFDYEIDGVSYHFSFDQEAQLNFHEAKLLFADNAIATINWTVTDKGVYKRIPIDKETMNKLSLVILEHKESNINKFRNVLMPKVEAANTKEEIDAIVW